jgi:hypothetical protein
VQVTLTARDVAQLALSSGQLLRDLLLAQEDERLRLIVANFMVLAARVRSG